MDRAKQVAAELQLLRSLCDEAVSHGQRLELLQSYNRHVFLEPEHQIVFESIRSLFPSGMISAARLTVHLNNRGFPDIDIDCYFPATPANCVPHESVNKERP